MRKVVLLGVVLLSVAAFSFLTVTPVERKILNPDGTTALSAPTRPTQVEVTNFPAVQSVSGTVNVGNLPAVQQVAGAVSVANLPLDGNGDLRVTAPESAAPVTATIEARFFESQRNAIGRFPLIALPSGFRMVDTSVQTLNETKMVVSSFSVGFGSDSAPTEHSILGDFQIFAPSVPLGFATGFITAVPQETKVRYAVAGTHLQLFVLATDPSHTGQPPADAEYYVHLFLSR